MCEDNVRGRIALVTGASRGIGRAVAVALAREGAQVVATARNEDKLRSLVEEAQGASGICVAISGDVRCDLDVQRVVERTLAEFGRVDILVNNAGIGLLGPFESATVADYDQTIATNMRSIFLFCHHVLPDMKRRGSGDVVNIASISGLQAFPGASLYCASKFATIGLSRALDNEYRVHGVRISSVCPAGTRTDWAVGTGRSEEDAKRQDLLSPETIAQAVLFAVNQPKNARLGEMVVYPMSEPGYL